MKSKLFLLFISVLFLVPSASAWYDASYLNATFLSANAATGIFSVNVSNLIGTNNDSYIFTNGHNQTNFSDIVVVLDNTTTGISFWFDNDTSQSGGSIVLWINKSIVGSSGVVGIYYNNPVVTSFPPNFNLTKVMPYADGWNGRWNYTYTQGGGTQNWVAQSNGTMMQTEATSTINRNLHILQTSMPTSYQVVTKMKFITVPTAGRGGVQLGRDAANDIGAGISQVSITGQNTIIQDNTAFGTAGTNSKTLVANDWFMVAGYTTGTAEQSKIYPVNKNDTQWQGSGAYTSSTTKYIGMYGTSGSASAYQYWYAWNGTRINLGTFGSESSVGTIGAWGNNLTNDRQTDFNSLVTVPIRFNVSGTGVITDRYEWSVNGTNQSNNLNSFVYNFPSLGTTTINETSVNTTSGSTSTIIWQVTVINYSFQLISPANGSSVSTPVILTSREWVQNAPYTYTLCLDVTCNSIVSSGIMTSTNTTDEYITVSLIKGVTYYWYVTNSLGVSTVTRNFTISLPTQDGQTGIQGQVYTLINGAFTPISGASVFIYNGSYSRTIITGSDGYFLIEPLANASVYFLQGKAPNYNDGNIEPVNTSAGNWVLHNIELQPCTASFTCNINQFFVTFAVQNLFFTRYPGVDVKVYAEGSSVLLDEGSTNTAGEVNFYLIKDKHYTFIFTNTSFGISQTWTGTPPQSGFQYIIVSANSQGQFTNNTDIFATVTTTVSTSTNGNTGYINMSYVDVLAQTTNLIFYLNQSIAADPNNQTNLQIINGGSNSVFNASFAVSPFAGNSYIIAVTSQQSTLGTISRSYGVVFPNTTPLSAFNSTSILMMIVGLILFIAGFWGQTSTEQGAGIIVGIVWLLSGIGLFTNINLGLAFYLGLTLATIISIIMNINARARREGIA